MIEYIQGEIITLTPTFAILDIHGIGYGAHISLNTFTALEGKKEARLLTHEIIREDAHLLYGFACKEERDLFRLLIGVSGVGANTARMILSSIPPQQLQEVIAGGDVKSLKAVKGVGVKTAERIIVDLRDKIKSTSPTLSIEHTQSSAAFDEALAALQMLGFAKAQSEKALARIFKENPNLRVELAIKQALTML